MASPASSFRHQQPIAARQPQALSRSALKARDAVVLEHLPLADAIASASARRLLPLVERDDLIQVARDALVSSAERCRSGEPAEPYLRRCITGALQHHLRDRVRLARISRREHEKGTCPLGDVTHAALSPERSGGVGTRVVLIAAARGRGRGQWLALRVRRCPAASRPSR